MCEDNDCKGATVEALNIAFRPMDSQRPAVLPLILGAKPMILLQFDQKKPHGETTVNVDCTGFETRAELAEMLEGMADLIREAVVHKAEWHDAEGEVTPMDVIDWGNI